MKQLTQIEQRQFELGKIRERLQTESPAAEPVRRKPILSKIDEPGPAQDLYTGYGIAQNEADSIHLPTYVDIHRGDPALQVSRCTLPRSTAWTNKM